MYLNNNKYVCKYLFSIDIYKELLKHVINQCKNVLSAHHQGDCAVVHALSVSG